MICIFCLKEKGPSKEHVFPEGIGGSLTIDRVCKDCNDELGAKVDAPLVNHPFTAMARSQLGITGKRDDAPDLFAEVFGVGNLASDPDQKVRAYVSPETGKLAIEALHRRRESLQADGTKTIQVTIDKKNANVSTIGKIIERAPCWKPR
jgi:HNH endonuclease